MIELASHDTYCSILGQFMIIGKLLLEIGVQVGFVALVQAGDIWLPHHALTEVPLNLRLFLYLRQLTHVKAQAYIRHVNNNVSIFVP